MMSARSDGNHYAASVRIILTGLILLFVADIAGAQLLEIPPTWGGSFGHRPRLTGDWFGVRDEMGKKGIVLDLDLLLTPQGVVIGGRNTEGDFWGNSEYTLNVDIQKLGLWPGGFLNVSAISGFGDTVSTASGPSWLGPDDVVAFVDASEHDVAKVN